MSPYLLAQLGQRPVVATPMHPHRDKQRSEPLHFQPCVHKHGCRFLAHAAATGCLPCGWICWDRHSVR